jgi:hypothetical protein
MNKDDGSWRFIYYGPNGQMIGSLRPTSLLQTALSSQGIPGLSLLGGLGGGAQSPGPPGAAANQQQGAGMGLPGQQGNAMTTGNPLESQPQPLMGAVLGGNIAGVGSKIKKPSLKVYMGGDTYQEWEFIFNANGQQVVIPGQAPLNPNGIQSGAPSATPPNNADPNAPGAQQTPQTPPVIPPATSPAQ